MSKVSVLASSVLLVTLVSVAAFARTHTMAMTVDDLPFASGNSVAISPADAKSAGQVNRKILKAFAHHHIPATGFVIEERAEELSIPVSKKILKQWTGPGFDLGNHLYSHPDVNTLSIEQVENQITRGEQMFAPLLANVSSKPEFLRFPYNHTGDTKEKHDAIAAFMTARGYRLAPCTIDNTDYEFNTSYVLAISRHNDREAAKIRAAYIAYTGAEIDYYTALNKQVFGYEPPHIMLLHDSSLNADTIEEVILLFEQRGYRFVTLNNALKDPAYAVPETYITKYGPMWGYRWAQERHVKVNGRAEPDPPAWIEEYAKTARAGH